MQVSEQEEGSLKSISTNSGKWVFENEGPQRALGMKTGILTSQWKNLHRL